MAISKSSVVFNVTQLEVFDWECKWRVWVGGFSLVSEKELTLVALALSEVCCIFTTSLAHAYFVFIPISNMEKGILTLVTVGVKFEK